MLPSSRRIPRTLHPAARPAAFHKGSFFSLSLFPYEKDSRFAVSISKKTAKKAVVRNKLRRWGYRAIGERIAGIKPGFLAKFSIHALPTRYEEASADIERLLSQLGLLR